MSRLIRLCLLFTLLPVWPLAAADLAREARIAAEIEEAILDGEVLRLKAGTVEFLAVYRPAAAQRRGAAILLHGRGAHPEWSEVIRPLAIGLPEHGWDTLAIQLPVAAADAPPRDWEALLPEAGPRISAALDWLGQQGRDNPVLVGHSLGARMAVAYLAAASPQPPVRALVAIGLPAAGSDSPTMAELRQLRLPVLDIYGERDLPLVREGAADREQAARAAGNPAYTQVSVPGADHFFAALDDALVSRVRAWLSRLGG